MNATPIASTIEAPGWTLLHFVWQGAALALALWCFLGMARKASPQARYAAGCAALLAMLLSVAVTLGRQLALASGEAPAVATDGRAIAPQPRADVTIAQRPRAIRDAIPTDASPAPTSGGGGSVVPQSAESAGRWQGLLESGLAAMESAVRPWLGWVVGLWAAGVGLFSARLLACWSATRGMRSRGREPEGQHAVWLERFARLRQRLGVARPVRLLCTASAGVPMVIGWLKPVVLVPAGLLTGLSVPKLEAILAHELAHIRRHDYLVNLLQNVVETLFFYHPAVWWVSGQVRREREHCCDDAASAVCGDAVDYARALAALEEWRGLPAALGVSAGGSTLPGRIRRLVGVKHAEHRGAGLPVVAGVFAVCAVVALLLPDGAGRGEEQTVPSGIRITVLDSTGKNPIREFRVIAGVRSGATTQDFTKRTGREVVNWQAHTVRIGKNGSYVWPLEQAYDEMALRVEADGYAPQEWAWAKKADGAQHVIFKLAEDAGVRGRVLRPDGGPAAAATVALALPQKSAVIEQGHIRGAGEPLPENPSERWRRPTLVRTGPDGRFVLPTEIDPAAAVLVVHESGVREMAYAEFREAPEITLQRWGRIEGTVLWKDKPGVDDRITLSIWRDEYGYPEMISTSAETRTDADGRFTFDKVLPGRAQISRPIGPSEDGAAGAGEFIFDGQFVHAHVKPGDPTAVLLGGRGRTVTGRLTGRDTWDDVTFHFHPDAPHIGFPGDDDAWKAFGRLRNSAIGPLFFRDKLKPKADGTFEIPDMLPGRYQFFVSARGVDNYAAYTVIKLDPEKPDEAPEPLDLGQIPVKAGRENAPPKAGADTPSGQHNERTVDREPEERAKIVTIRGKAVDADTGEPVFPLIVQAGKFDPADPAKVTWGYSEARTSARNGRFSTTVRWGEGWTARVLADGYLPAPVLTEAPPADQDTVEVVLRLKRGRLVRGLVLDHEGQPVKGAAVFAVGPTGLNLAAGKAWNTFGGENKAAKPVLTDAAGRFELPAGGATRLAVSSESLDAWPAPIPEEGEVVVKLPAPARIDVAYDIEGAAAKGKVFYQLLSNRTPGFERLECTRELPVANGGTLTLAALPPGKYQICRTVRNRVGELGMGAMLDRQFLELKPGETRSIRFVREKGARLRGKVIRPEGTKLAGIVVTVKSEKTEKDPFGGREWQTELAADTAAEDATFRTELIPPGRHLLVAEGYTPLTPEQRFRTGVIAPAFRAQIAVDVPASGEVTVPDVQLKKVEN